MGDQAHDFAERKIAEFQAEVWETYQQAQADAQEALSRFLKRFEKEDERQREKVKAGELSEADYKAWRKGKILRSRQLSSTLDQVSQAMTEANQVAMAEGFERLFGSAWLGEAVHPGLKLFEGDFFHLTRSPHRQQVAAQGALVALNRGATQTLGFVGHVHGRGFGKQHLLPLSHRKNPRRMTAVTRRKRLGFSQREALTRVRHRGVTMPIESHQGRVAGRKGDDWIWRQLPRALSAASRWPRLRAWRASCRSR